ncbi:MAG: bifunctional homocysteine S-methyltransferase/methylenetetrahydrofolate reductase [Clostridia bacterium]|nr:bifunctional homocysteine S-methyltransferase/methylenetetrahydrofolate reductase [Clostridia bacterium]
MDAQKTRKLLERGTLLFDGATGTYAKRFAGWPEGPVEAACVTAPEMVTALHKAYVDEGCHAVKTNTFAAHVGLAARDEAHQRKIVLAAIDAVRAAVTEETIIFADIGPAPCPEQACQAYIRMAELFLDVGVECFLFETMPSAKGIEQAASYIRSRNPDAFIAVSFAAGPDGFTREGEAVSALLEEMDGCADIEAVGLNCMCGAYHMRRLLAEMKKPVKHLIAMPNAGYPHIVDGRVYYDSDPAYYAQQVMECAKLGAAIVGGCCGTTPEHIRQLRVLLLRDVPGSRRSQASHMAEDGRVCESGIKKKLERAGRIVLVELDPPRDSDIDAFIAGARRLSKAGADAITIADCPIGRASMDASLLACKLRRELGIEALPHMTCRDRNVNATKALLLGLSMEGVHNVLAVTGDPVPTGDRDSVKGVFQFNSRVLARFVRSLSHSGETAPFFLCGALNVNAVNFDAELERAKEKEACGMEAFLTQPVLSERAAENIEAARSVLNGRIFAGLFPVVSHRNAQFLHSEVAGIAMEERVVNAYKGLDRAQGEELAVRLCRDAAARVAHCTDGFYIMTPFQRVELVCRVMKAIKEL